MLQDGQHVAVGFQSGLAMILSWPSSPGVCTWTLQLRRKEGHRFDSTCLSEGDFSLVPNHPIVLKHPKQKAVVDENIHVYLIWPEPVQGSSSFVAKGCWIDTAALTVACTQMGFAISRGRRSCKGSVQIQRFEAPMRRAQSCLSSQVGNCLSHWHPAFILFLSHSTMAALSSQGKLWLRCCRKDYRLKPSGLSNAEAKELETERESRRLLRRQGSWQGLKQILCACLEK